MYGKISVIHIGRSSEFAFTARSNHIFFAAKKKMLCLQIKILKIYMQHLCRGNHFLF